MGICPQVIKQPQKIASNRPFFLENYENQPFFLVFYYFFELLSGQKMDTFSGQKWSQSGQMARKSGHSKMLAKYKVVTAHF